MLISMTLLILWKFLMHLLYLHKLSSEMLNQIWRVHLIYIFYQYIHTIVAGRAYSNWRAEQKKALCDFSLQIKFNLILEGNLDLSVNEHGIEAIQEQKQHPRMRPGLESPLNREKKIGGDQFYCLLFLSPCYLLCECLEWKRSQ